MFADNMIIYIENPKKSLPKKEKKVIISLIRLQDIR